MLDSSGHPLRTWSFVCLKELYLPFKTFLVGGKKSYWTSSVYQALHQVVNVIPTNFPNWHQASSAASYVAVVLIQMVAASQLILMQWVTGHQSFIQPVNEVVIHVSSHDFLTSSCCWLKYLSFLCLAIYSFKIQIKYNFTLQLWFVCITWYSQESPSKL